MQRCPHFRELDEISSTPYQNFVLQDTTNLQDVFTWSEVKFLVGSNGEDNVR